MKKSLIVGMISLMAFSVFAETDTEALAVIKKIRNGTTEKNSRIETLHVEGAANVGGALTAGSVAAPVTGDVTGSVSGPVVRATSTLIVTPTAQSVTNGQAVTLTSGSLLSGVGQAAALTNTVTIVAPGTANVGKFAFIAIGATSSNIVAIADQAPCDLSAAAALGVGDTLMLWATSATTWLEVSRSNN